MLEKYNSCGFVLTVSLEKVPKRGINITIGQERSFGMNNEEEEFVNRYEGASNISHLKGADNVLAFILSRLARDLKKARRFKNAEKEKC